MIWKVKTTYFTGIYTHAISGPNDPKTAHSACNTFLALQWFPCPCRTVSQCVLTGFYFVSKLESENRPSRFVHRSNMYVICNCKEIIASSHDFLVCSKSVIEIRCGLPAPFMINSLLKRPGRTNLVSIALLPVQWFPCRADSLCQVFIASFRAQTWKWKIEKLKIWKVLLMKILENL